jgi:hypothetical protein
VATVSGKHFSWMGIHSLALNFGDGNDTLDCQDIEQLHPMGQGPALLSASGGPGNDVLTIEGASNVEIDVNGDDDFESVGNDQITVGDISDNYGSDVGIIAGLGDDYIFVHDTFDMGVLVFGDLQVSNNTPNPNDTLGGRDTLRVEVDDNDTTAIPPGHGDTRGSVSFETGDKRDEFGARTGEGADDLLIVSMSEMPDSVAGQMSVGYHKEALGFPNSHVGVVVSSGGTERCDIVCDPLYEEGWQFIGGDGDDRIDLGARPPDVDTNQDWLKNASVSAGDGDDVIGVGTDLDADDTIGGNNIDGFVGLKFDGGDGSDEVRFYDQDNPSTSSRHYVTSNNDFQLPSFTMSWDDDVTNLEIAGAYMAPKKTFGSAYFDVNNMPSDVQLFVAGGTDADVTVGASPHPVLLRPGVGAYNVDIHAGASAAMDYDHEHDVGSRAPLILSDMTIDAGAELSFGSGVPDDFLVSISTLTMFDNELAASRSIFDLGEYGMKIGAFNGTITNSTYPLGHTVTGIAGLTSFCKKGFHDGGSSEWGLWSGATVSNTTIVSVVLGDDYNNRYSTFAGASVGDGDMLVRFSWVADATLDQVVDIDDLYQLATHWHTSTSGWFNGDFDYSGYVDATDLGILSVHWQDGVSGGGSSWSAALALFGL